VEEVVGGGAGGREEEVEEVPLPLLSFTEEILILEGGIEEEVLTPGLAEEILLREEEAAVDDAVVEGLVAEGPLKEPALVTMGALIPTDVGGEGCLLIELGTVGRVTVTAGDMTGLELTMTGATDEVVDEEYEEVEGKEVLSGWV
jgi:hypothetical protein